MGKTKNTSSEKTFKESVSNAIRVTNTIYKIQQSNELPLDLVWALDDIVDTLSKLASRLDKYKKQLYGQFGLAELPSNPNVAELDEVPTDEEQNQWKKDNPDKPVPIWWDMDGDSRIREVKTKVDELLEKEEKVTITPIKYEDLSKAGVKISGSLGPLKKNYIIR